MPVCPKCRSEFEKGAEWCAACDVVLLVLVTPPRPTFIEPKRAGGGGTREGRASGKPVRGDSSPGGPSEGRRRAHADPPPAPAVPTAEEKLILLLEEPLPEMAEMISEFLENCGIRSVVHSESIGLLYRLPAPGAPISRARVYVLESDFQEARELVAHFFDRT
jgi:hypothetical protein